MAGLPFKEPVMAQKAKPIAEQLQSIAEYQTACKILQEVKELLPHSNPASHAYINPLVKGFENWCADPFASISKEPPRIKMNPDGSHTVERTEARISPHGFIWMAAIWLKSTNQWVEEQKTRKKRERKARERLRILRHAKTSLSANLYAVAHAYHNHVTGRQCPAYPRSVEEMVLNTEQFLAETERHIREVAHIERQFDKPPLHSGQTLGKAA